MIQFTTESIDALMAQARRLEGEGNLSGAVTVYQRILGMHAGHAGAKHRLGVLRVRGGNVQAGVALLRESVQADPGLAEAHRDLGTILAQTGQPRTMRVDYFHSGGMGQEIVALDRVVSDGSWAGSRTRLIDDLNLGKYLFEVIDRDTNRPIYSRGFASIYGEWETTAEYKTLHRTFGESLRFPWPKSPVQVVLKKRDRDNSFHELWSTSIDPDSRFVNRADPPKAGNVWTMVSMKSPVVAAAIGLEAVAM